MSTTSDWLAGYERAWRTKDAADVRAIFSDDAEYWFHPDDPHPIRGIDAIVTMWETEPEPVDPVYELSVLVEDGAVGIITGRVDYPGRAHYIDLWEVHFAEDGRARRFVEWPLTAKSAEESADE
jgi:ketosteroid isomerase-like protein